MKLVSGIPWFALFNCCFLISPGQLQPQGLVQSNQQNSLSKKSSWKSQMTIILDNSLAGKELVNMMRILSNIQCKVINKIVAMWILRMWNLHLFIRVCSFHDSIYQSSSLTPKRTEHKTIVVWVQWSSDQKSDIFIMFLLKFKKWHFNKIWNKPNLHKASLGRWNSHAIFSMWLCAYLITKSESVDSSYWWLRESI